MTEKAFTAAGGLAGLVLGAGIAARSRPRLDPAASVTIDQGGEMRALSAALDATDPQIGLVGDARHRDARGAWFRDAALREPATDNYDAWVRLLTRINAGSVAEVVIPPGRYWINRYLDAHPSGPRDARAVAANFPRLLVPRGLRISGEGAALVLAGGYHKPTDYTAAQFAYSHVAALSPLVIQRGSRDVTIEGLEIDGAVDTITRAEGQAESYAYHVLVEAGTERITLRDVRSHRSMTDGVAIGKGESGSSQARDVRLERVVSTRHARNAFTVLEADGVVCIDCEFSEVGRAGGTYGVHAPACGVDVEPELARADNVTFERCRIRNNAASIFLCGSAERSRNIVLRDCDLDHGEEPRTAPNAIILAAAGGVIQGGRIALGPSGIVYPTYAGQTETDVVIRDLEISGATSLLVSEQLSGHALLVERVRVTGTHTAQFGTYIPYIQNPRAEVRDCEFFFPAAMHNGQGLHVISLMGAGRVRRNVYRTNLDGSEGRHFAVFYPPEADVVEGERYEGRNGSMRVYREPRASWIRPFSRGAMLASLAQVGAVTAAGLRWTSGPVRGGAYVTAEYGGVKGVQLSDVLVPAEPQDGAGWWATVESADTSAPGEPGNGVIRLHARSEDAAPPPGPFQLAVLRRA